MIKFNNSGFVIKVLSPTPAGSYVKTMNDIIDLLQAQDPELQRDNYHLLQLLQAMLPTEEQAHSLLMEMAKCN